MKKPLLYTLLFFAAFAGAQDQVYFLDGTSKAGKITEVGPEYVVLQSQAGADEIISKELLLLIEFRNGSADIIQTPQRSLIYDPASAEEAREVPAPGREPLNHSLGSINTLALCNADLAGFYERILPGKKIGLGLMGAYNFNQYATISNLFIAVLYNARKKYDLGAFANLYLGGYHENTSFYCGLMMKYMKFTFSSVVEEKVNSGGLISTNIKYRASEGSQLATLITCGSHTNLKNGFFFRTMIGIGGFNMRGDYKAQYNYLLNQANQSAANPDPVVYNRRFLLKVYAGINLGFSF